MTAKQVQERNGRFEKKSRQKGRNFGAAVALDFESWTGESAMESLKGEAASGWAATAESPGLHWVGFPMSQTVRGGGEAFLAHSMTR